MDEQRETEGVEWGELSKLRLFFSYLFGKKMKYSTNEKKVNYRYILYVYTFIKYKNAI